MNQGLLSVDEALARLLAEAKPVAEIEDIPTLDATNRILARAQTSTMDVPPMDNSAMDGYAVRVADGQHLQVVQKIMAGAVGEPLIAGTAARIFTGAPIPPGADAVDHAGEHDHRRQYSAAEEVPAARRLDSPRRQRRAQGRRDPAGGQAAAAAGHGTGGLGRYQHLAGVQKSSLGAVLYRGRARHARRGAGARVASTTRTASRCADWASCSAASCTTTASCPDSLEATREVLRRAAAECDVIVTSGGVSVGDADYVKPAVEAEGKLLMWRIAMKPGRPLAFGSVQKAFFIGLPGNPVSSFVTFLIFVRPFLLRTQGLTSIHPRSIAARADFEWLEPDARREFLRVKWNAEGGLDLYPTQDSAVLTSTSWAHGLVDNPAAQPIRKGDLVRFLPYSELYW